MEKMEEVFSLTLSDPFFVERLMMEFPFLQQIREYVGSFGIRLEDFSDPSMSRLVENAVARVEEALSKGVRIAAGTSHAPSEDEILSYPLSIALVVMLEDSYALRRFATVEAERYSRILERIDRSRVRDVIHYVATHVLGMEVRLGTPPYEFHMRFTDYLRHAPKLNEPRFKLVNRLVKNGYVMLRRPEMMTLVKNALEEYIEERLRAVGRIAAPDFLRPYVERLKGLLETRKWRETGTGRALTQEMWPPCMRALYQRLLSGEHVSHFGNFTIASFLLNIGWGIEDVISIYSQRGDFDERIARYQVEHIAGQRGGRTRYTTPNCRTIQAHGLCIENGRLCGGIKHPLQYSRREGKRPK